MWEGFCENICNVAMRGDPNKKERMIVNVKANKVVLYVDMFCALVELSGG